jgi:hypothetical protein
MSSQARVKRMIVASEVSGCRRLGFLPALFGARLMLRGEALVYTSAGRLSDGYTGGSWSFYTLSHGGGYLVPTCAERFTVQVEGNGFDGEVSADAFGIIVTLFALNKLLFFVDARGGDTAHLMAAYYALRAFGSKHVEATAIMRAID